MEQKLLQKLSPQQIQLMKLLQLPTVELEQRIKEEMEINPALEEGREEDERDEMDNDEFDDDYTEDEGRDDIDIDIDDYLSDDEIPEYRLEQRNRGADDEDRQVPVAGGKTFQDYLVEQLHLRDLSEEDEEIAEVLVGNLDEAGYLRRDLDNLLDDLAFAYNINTTLEKLNELLKVIQELDPPGIGARDLRECLLLQLRRRERTVSNFTAIKVLEDHFEEFTRKHYDKILKKLEIIDEDLKDAIDEIVKLNPKPGNSVRETSRAMQDVVPDFFVVEQDGELVLTVNGRNAPEMRVSRQYQEMLKAYSESKTKDRAQKEAVLFVKQKIDSARWFMEAIRQRQNTLFTTMHAIMDYQREYFLSGDETRIKPMILKDIADIVGLDISTVSRVANSKYVTTQYGTYLLKYFFSESLTTDSGEEVSTREVKKILQDAIDGEEKRNPLTDEALAVLLNDKGYNIARRTVAKYREQLNIPVARMRKEL
jgi:RNA polymerase sigma-54 factor